MPEGPVDLVVLTFAGDNFSGKIVPAVRKLVDEKTVRIVDLLFVRKNHEGKVEIIEFTDLGHVDRTAWTPLVSEIEGLLSESDAHQVANLLANQSAAVMLLFEDVWARSFRARMQEAQVELLLFQRVPHTLVGATLTAVPSSLDLVDPGKQAESPV